MHIKKNIPNILTTIRLLLVPFFIIFFINKSYLISLIIFVIASLTDFIDGYLARRWNVESKYGKVIDPIADKSLMISALLLCIIYINRLTIIPILLEIIIALTNFLYYKNGCKFHVTYIGKIKTAILMTTISYIILNKLIGFNNILEIVLIILTIILQLFTIITYYIYQKKNKK